MKKTIILGVAIIALWGMFWLIPYLLIYPQKETLDFYDVLFSAASALFAGFAVCIAYRALLEDKNSLTMQIRINVFSEAMRMLLQDLKFQESQEYIYSKTYREDIDTVKRVLNVEGEIGLEDFKRILYQNLIQDNPEIRENEKSKERIRVSYKKITYFCSRMEYLGVISEEKASAILLMEYYGQTVIETYKKLEPLIIKTREDQNSEEIYKHYTQLYNFAKKNQ